MIPTREQLIEDLTTAKEQSIKKWEDNVADCGREFTFCGYCKFRDHYQMSLKGISKNNCPVCPISKPSKNIYWLCIKEFIRWSHYSTPKNAQVVLDIVKSVNVEEWVDKLLEIQNGGE